MSRNVHDPRALAAILEKAEADLAAKKHPGEIGFLLGDKQVVLGWILASCKEESVYVVTTTR